MNSPDQDFIAAVNKAQRASTLMDICANGKPDEDVPAREPYPTAQKKLDQIEKNILQGLDPTITEIAEIVGKTEGFAKAAEQSAEEARGVVGQVKTEGDRLSSRLVSETTQHLSTLTKKTEEVSAIVEKFGDVEGAISEAEKHAETAQNIADKFGDVDHAVTEATKQAEISVSHALQTTEDRRVVSDHLVTVQNAAQITANNTEASAAHCAKTEEYKESAKSSAQIAAESVGDYVNATKSLAAYTHETVADAVADDNSLRRALKILERSGDEFRQVTDLEYAALGDCERFTDERGVHWGILNRSVFNRRVVDLAVGAEFSAYDESGRVLFPRLRVGPVEYVAITPDSVIFTSDEVVTDGNGVISVQTNKGTKRFGRTNAEAVTREELSTMAPSYFVSQNYGCGTPKNGSFLNPLEFGEWWIPPRLAPLPSHEYTSSGVSAQWIIDTYYRDLESLRDVSVSKTQLGTDCTGRNPVYQYVFTPHSFTRTILLMSGVHGTERQSVHQLGRFLNHIYTKNDPMFTELRNNTRVVVLPVCNPSGINANTYRTADNVDINRDYDFRTPYGKTMFKGVETRIIRDAINSWADDLSFIMDWHTVAKHSGYGDIYLVYDESLPIHTEMQRVAGYYENMFKRMMGRNPVSQVGGNLFNNSVSWGSSCVGIPTVIPETNENSWGRDFNDELHCYKALEFYGNSLLGLMRAVPDNKRLPVLSAFGGRFNYQWNASEIIKNIYDPLLNSVIKKTILGKDASGTFDIPCYQIRRSYQSRKILIIAGVNGRSVKGAMALAQFVHHLIKKPYDYPKLNTFDLDIVPIVNMFGMNQGSGYGGGSNRKASNADGVLLKSDFDSFSSVEATYIKNLMDSGIYDYCIEIDSFESEDQNGTPFELFVPYQTEDATSKMWLANHAMSRGYTYYWQKQKNYATPQNYLYQTYKIPAFKIILNDNLFADSTTFNTKEMATSVDYIADLLISAAEFPTHYKRAKFSPATLAEGTIVNIGSSVPFRYRSIILNVDFGYPNGDSGVGCLEFHREQLIPLTHRSFTISAAFLNSGAPEFEFVNLRVTDTGQKVSVTDLYEYPESKPITLSSVYYK